MAMSPLPFDVSALRGCAECWPPWDTDAGIAWPAEISRSRLRWKKDARISKNLLVQIRIEQRGGPLRFVILMIASGSTGHKAHSCPVGSRLLAMAEPRFDQLTTFQISGAVFEVSCG